MQNAELIKPINCVLLSLPLDGEGRLPFGEGEKNGIFNIYYGQSSPLVQTKYTINFSNFFKIRKCSQFIHNYGI